MGPEQIQAFYSLANAARGLGAAVAGAAADLHGGAGISPAMRAVLETVIVTGPRTVPAIARSRGVSRQHVQALVDRLGAAGFVETRRNPAHRRSLLIAATALGRAALSDLRARELAALSRLDAAVGADAMRAARETLAVLAAALQGPQWRTIAAGVSRERVDEEAP